MIKLMDLYDDIKRGQEVVEDIHWQPPKDMDAQDVTRLARLDKALDLVLELFLVVMAEELPDEPEIPVME